MIVVQSYQLSAHVSWTAHCHMPSNSTYCKPRQTCASSWKVCDVVVGFFVGDDHDFSSFLANNSQFKQHVCENIVVICSNQKPKDVLIETQHTLVRIYLHYNTRVADTNVGSSLFDDFLSFSAMNAYRWLVGLIRCCWVKYNCTIKPTNIISRTIRRMSWGQRQNLWPLVVL